MEAYLEAPEGLLQRQVWEWVFSLLAPASDPSFTDPMGTPPTLPDPMSPDGIYGGMKVPEGVGLPRDVYVAALKSLGFGVDVRVKLDFNRDHDPDDVLHVDPAPGARAPANSTVEVVINPTTVTVPQPLSTETADEYAERVYDRGLAPSLEADSSSTAGEGTITGPVTPTPGTETEPHERVSVPYKPQKSRRSDPDCEGYDDPRNPAQALEEQKTRHKYRVKETLGASHESDYTVPLRWEGTYRRRSLDRDVLPQQFLFDDFGGFGLGAHPRKAWLGNVDETESSARARRELGAARLRRSSVRHTAVWGAQRGAMHLHGDR